MRALQLYYAARVERDSAHEEAMSTPTLSLPAAGLLPSQPTRKILICPITCHSNSKQFYYSLFIEDCQCAVCILTPTVVHLDYSNFLIFQSVKCINCSDLRLECTVVE